MPTTPLNVIMIKKNGNSQVEMYPLTNDSRVVITSDSSKIPNNVETLQDLIDSFGSLAFEDYVALNVSDENNYGLVKLANADNTDTDTVPTSYYLHTITQSMVTSTGAQNVSGIKNFTNGVEVGGKSVTYDSVSDVINYGPVITPAEPEEEG